MSCATGKIDKIKRIIDKNITNENKKLYKMTIKWVDR